MCCKYQKFSLTFTDTFGFFLNFSTSWNICVKEQWTKKSLFQNFWLISWFVTGGQTEDGKNFSAWNHDILSSKQSKLNFWNPLHPKFACACPLLTQTATWWPNHSILTSCVTAILKAMTEMVFLRPILRVVRIFYLRLEVFQWERVLCVWMAGHSHMPNTADITLNYLDFVFTTLALPWN